MGNFIHIGESHAGVLHKLKYVQKPSISPTFDDETTQKTEDSLTPLSFMQIKQVNRKKKTEKIFCSCFIKKRL